MFKRDHHLRIANILHALDAKALIERECYFGGGTAIVLANNEYRESLDIDFLVSNPKGYKDLRHQLTGKNGLASIFQKSAEIKMARELRTDQYGLRTMLDAGGVSIKFEIIFEGRISLDPPGPKDKICGVPTLTAVDLGASKLLANSDRWADDAIFSRDLIDFAMLDLTTKKKKQAIAKASSAYGPSVLRDLKKAVANLKTRPGRLEHCMAALKIDDMPTVMLWEKIRKLAK